MVTDALSHRTHLLNVLKVQIKGFKSLNDSYVACPDFGPIICTLELGMTLEHRDYLLTDDIYSLRIDCAFPVLLSGTSSRGSVTPEVLPATSAVTR